MPWEAPSTTDVLSEFTPAEEAALKSLQGDAAGENLPSILARIVAKWRGAIRSGGYAVDEDVTVLPLELHDDVVAMTRWRYIVAARTGGKVMQTAERKAANEAAEEKLKKIAAGQCSVEPPSAQPGTGNRFGSYNSENKIIGRMHPVPRPGVQTSGDADRYANADGPEDAG